MVLLDYLIFGKVISVINSSAIVIKTSESQSTYVNKNNLTLEEGDDVLLECTAYPGDEGTSYYCDVICALPTGFTKISLFQVKDENSFIDVNNNKWIIDKNKYSGKSFSHTVDIGFYVRWNENIHGRAIIVPELCEVEDRTMSYSDCVEVLSKIYDCEYELQSVIINNLITKAIEDKWR